MRTSSVTGTRHPMSRRSFALGFGVGVISLLVVGLILGLMVSDPAGSSVATSPTVSPTSRPSAAPPTLTPGQTWLSDVDVRSSDVLTTDGPLRDVTATGTGVSLTSDGLEADLLQIVATLPFETAAEQIGEDIELYPSGDLAGLRRRVEILGREVQVEATGRVRAQDGRLVIEPETVDLGSFDWIDTVASAAVRSLVTIRHTVTGIPGGMRLDAVEVRDDGFRVELSGADVRIAT